MQSANTDDSYTTVSTLIAVKPVSMSGHECRCDRPDTVHSLPGPARAQRVHKTHHTRNAGQGKVYNRHSRSKATVWGAKAALFWAGLWAAGAWHSLDHPHAASLPGFQKETAAPGRKTGGQFGIGLGANGAAVSVDYSWSHIKYVQRLSEEARSQLEDPDSTYNFGYSCGRETLEGGLPDLNKISYYANPVHNTVTDDPELRQRYPSYCRQGGMHTC